MIKNLLFVLLATALSTTAHAQKNPKILLVTGGCCHSYELQAKILKECLPNNTNTHLTIVNDGGKGTDAKIALYNKRNWAKGYDLVIHNECFAETKDTAYIKKITKAHYQGKNAVVIHCALHTYRDANSKDWTSFLGVSSKRHEHLDNYEIVNLEPNHPAMQGMPHQWTSEKDELYVIDKVMPTVTPLAQATSKVNGKSYPVIWTNTYGKARVFGVSFGHSDDTFKSAAFKQLLRNGISWALYAK